MFTWRIIPLSRWLITMVSKSPKWGYSPDKWPKWLINGVLYNYLLSGMILQEGVMVYLQTSKKSLPRPWQPTRSNDPLEVSSCLAHTTWDGITPEKLYTLQYMAGLESHQCFFRRYIFHGCFSIVMSVFRCTNLLFFA